MSKFSLALCRYCLCAWIGAAALFVASGVAEVRSPQLDSFTKNALVSMRFPHYYRFGFWLVGTALVTSVLARANPDWSKRRATIASGLSLLALIIMVVDYQLIFQPLLEMMQRDVLSSKFEQYHEWSKNINMASLSVLFIAAWVACWPKASRSGSLTDA